AAGQISGAQEIITGTIPAPFNNVASASGGTCTHSYQWQSKITSTWNNIAGATGATYASPALTQTTSFRRALLCGSEQQYSNEITITVYPLLTISESNPQQILVAGSQPQPLSVSAGGGDETYSYAWQQRNVQGEWIPAEGDTTKSVYAPPPLQDTTMYRCVVQSFGMKDTSAVITVFIYPALTAGNIGGNRHVLEGKALPVLQGQPAAGGRCNAWEYQWEQLSLTGQWEPVAGATAVVYQPGAIDSIASFRRTVTLPCTGETAISNEIKVIRVGRINGQQQLIMDNIPQPLKSIIPINSAQFTYKWEISHDGQGWSMVNGETLEAYYPVTSSAGTFYYRRTATDVATNEFATSNIVTVIVKAGPGSLNYYPTPSDYPVNYIVTCAPLEAVKEIADLTLVQQKRYSTVNYYDGLGRPMETVRPLHTPEGNDLVQWKTYDAAGRESRQYLPYPKANSVSGAFVLPADALPEQQGFYSSEGQYAFSEIIYEPSPLNRVTAVQGQGKAWQDKPVKSGYQTNTSPVNSWRANEDNRFTAFAYAANQLYVTQTTDENNNVSRVYKDKQDRVVMTEAYDGSRWLQTRYVYDDFSLVRAVLPPEAGSPDDEDRCFYYRYDERHRAVETKIPGAGWVYAIYDKRDRLVMAQDGNQRENKRWTFYTYDDFNREIRREEVQLQGNLSRADMRWLYENSEPPYTERMVMSETWYDGLTPDVLTPDPSPGGEGSSDLSFVADEVAKNSELATGNKGRVTMTKTRVLDPNNNMPERFLLTAFYYDNYGRMIQTVAENIMGGIDRTSNSYDFTGNVTVSKQVSTWAGDGDSGTLTLVTTFGYDALKRPTTVSLQINDRQPVTISALEYDELTRLKTKKLHGDAEIIDYTYNIRDWVTAINSNLFTEELFYEKPLGDVTPQYNGNISSMRWRTARQEEKTYAFAYDPINRLTASHFYNKNWSNNYTEQLSYDKNGNITALQRYRHLPDPIDNLIYTYNGNQLATITDNGTPDGYPQGVTEYAYDANGNNIFEGTRVRVAYNAINLPQQVQLLGGRGIKNVYAADGRKLKSEAKQGSEYIKEGTKTYSGNLVFDINDELDYIIFNESRILYNTDDNTFKYEYHLKDHLGSVRVAFVPTTNATDVVQENSYYPFGAPINDLSWTPKSTNRYLREGKEYISDFDWNKYDFTGRTFDSWTLRALQVDPMATGYYSMSPYALWGGNPIRVIDPTGMMLDWYEDIDKTLQYNPNVKSQADLKEGQKYVGETHQVKDRKGNVIEDYRADGSIMFSNEASGYARIWNNTQKTGKEEMGVITNNGVLVLPSYKNGKNTTSLRNYGYSFKNGNVVDAVENMYSTLGTIHTHPNGSLPSTHIIGYDDAGYGDLGFAAGSTPYKPVFVMQMQNKKINDLSFIISQPATYKDLMNGFSKFNIIEVTAGLPAMNSNSIQVKGGLIQFIKANNLKRYAK
ncbi:MAG: DUF6443 domain-containing protein, partial [Dysgonamonadaceae bacterium]|nr:DUF6443 domain-containing protein [Dysgonamonadaceae bacterium]